MKKVAKWIVAASFLLVFGLLIKPTGAAADTAGKTKLTIQLTLPTTDIPTQYTISGCQVATNQSAAAIATGGALCTALKNSTLLKGAIPTNGLLSIPLTYTITPDTAAVYRLLVLAPTAKNQWGTEVLVTHTPATGSTAASDGGAGTLILPKTSTPTATKTPAAAAATNSIPAMVYWAAGIVIALIIIGLIIWLARRRAAQKVSDAVGEAPGDLPSAADQATTAVSTAASPESPSGGTNA